MKEWVVIVFYVVSFVSYCVLHELIFKYRFKEVIFTLVFFGGVFFVAMLATGFNPLIVWLHISTLIIIVAYSVYIGIMMKTMREKIQKKVLGEFNVQDMLNNIFKNDMFKNDMSNNQEKEGDDDIRVTEEEDYEEDKSGKTFDVGDIIIDEEKNDEKENDKDKK